MVMYCCAFGCKEKYVKGGPVTFHSFPKDEMRRKQWEVQLLRKNFKVNNSTKICSKHFTADCFETQKFGGTWLKADALPTIFSFPDHLQKYVKKRKSPKKRRLSTENNSEAFQEETNSEQKSKHLHYLGDFDENDLTSPTKVVKALTVAKDQVEKYKKQIRNLTKQSKTLKKHISSLEERLNEVQLHMVSDIASSVLGVPAS